MMPRRTMAVPTGWTRWMWAALVAAVLVPGMAQAAAWRPQLIGCVGGTFAVLGEPSDGGSSVSLSAMWPVTRALSFGVMAHGDDAGSLVDSLRDAQGHGLPAGKIDQLHRAAWGASWRLDAAAPPWHGVSPYASGTWGYYKISDDQRGTSRGSIGSAGFSLGAGARRALARGFVLGAYVRYHRLFNDREGRFVSAGLEGTWR